jgi:hypothetical protein
MSSTATYSTIGGEMFDQISRKLYGQERYENVLMRENPQYMDVVKFDPGCILTVPAIQVSTNYSAVPWGSIYLTQ